MTEARRRLSPTARASLFTLRGGICHMCKMPIDGTKEAWDHSHVIPLAQGGKDELSNWDVAHRKCHRAHTAAVDMPAIAKTKRQYRANIGAKQSQGGIKSAPFVHAPPQRKASRPLNKQLPPRTSVAGQPIPSLYAEIDNARE